MLIYRNVYSIGDTDRQYMPMNVYETLEKAKEMARDQEKGRNKDGPIVDKYLYTLSFEVNKV